MPRYPLHIPNWLDDSFEPDDDFDPLPATSKADELGFGGTGSDDDFCIRCGTPIDSGHQMCQSCLDTIHQEPPPEQPYFYWPFDDEPDPLFSQVIEGTPPADPDKANPQGISPAGWAIVDAALIDEPPLDPDDTRPIQRPVRGNDEQLP